MSDRLLEIKGLSAWYNPDKKILKDFSIELGTNEVVGLIGMNGAGKTTFLKVLTGLLKDYEVTSKSFQGENIEFRDNAFKTKRYVVFAEDSSFQYFTFREYLSYVSGAYKKELKNVSEN